jgi:hypothetical protein
LTFTLVTATGLTERLVGNGGKGGNGGSGAMTGGWNDRVANDRAVCLAESCKAAPLFDFGVVLFSRLPTGFALAMAFILFGAVLASNFLIGFALALAFVLFTGRPVPFAILLFADFITRFTSLFLFDLFFFLVAICHPIFSKIAC